MKYYTIVFPGEFGQHVKETWSEDQILDSYYKYWCQKMVMNKPGSNLSQGSCIEDWCVVHWAVETDQWGYRIPKDKYSDIVSDGGMDPRN